MKRKLIVLALINFFCVVLARGSHNAGGEITYRYLGKEKYEVTFKLYRDCRGGPLFSPKFELMCAGTYKTQTMSATLISIREISTACARAGKTCNPQNTTVSSIGFEEHLFKDTLDFNNQQIDFKNCCLIKIGMGQCCRTNRITTGGSGNYFWVNSSLDLCKAKINTSPVFLLEPAFITSCNQAAYRTFLAHDTVDNDSLSYSFTDPLANWTVKVSWNTGFNSNYPIDVYFPSGWTDKTKSNPKADPPIGIYLDPKSAALMFTPTTCDQVSQLAISVKEWRKDSLGSYQQIGEIIRDIQLTVLVAPQNDPPKIIGKEEYTICEGEEFITDFQTDDVPFKLPPPNQSPPPDTTYLSWDNGIKGASFKTINDSVRERIGRFTWTPPKGSISQKRYYFTIKVNDNFCPLNAVNYKTIQIYVPPTIKVSHKLETLNDYTVVLNGHIADTTIKGIPMRFWQIFDSMGNPFSATNLPLYVFVKGVNSNKTSDTLVFRRNGKYILYHSITAPGACTKYFKDTIIVRGIKMAIVLGTTGDTMVCEKTKVRLTPKIIKGIPPYKFTWKKDGKLLADTTAYYEFMTQGRTIKYFMEVEVSDSLNQINSTLQLVNVNYFLPKINSGKDTIICFNTEAKLKAKPMTKSEMIVQWSWLKNGSLIGNSDSLQTSKPGIYESKAVNKYGCISYDTIVLSNFLNTKPQLVDGNHCQNKGELSQIEFLRYPLDLRIYTKFEWILIKSLKDKFGKIIPIGSLLKDLDASSAFNYILGFGKNVVDLGVNKKDSLIFILKVTDSSKCQSADTMRLNILKTPEISTSFKNQEYCTHDSIDLSRKITSNLPLKMRAENHIGYHTWPLEGDIGNGIIKANYFKQKGGIYFVRIIAENEKCTVIDSVNLMINQSPIAEVDVAFFGDSVKFIDNSKFSTSRYWYLGIKFQTTDKNLVSSRLDAHLQPIKLSLKNSKCTFDTIFSIKTLAVNHYRINPIKIYPNPASQILTIETKNSKPCHINIYNALGQIAMSKQLNSTKETIDVYDLCKGVYTLEIFVGEVISRSVFVKH